MEKKCAFNLFYFHLQTLLKPDFVFKGFKPFGKSYFCWSAKNTDNSAVCIALVYMCGSADYDCIV